MRNTTLRFIDDPASLAFGPFRQRIYNKIRENKNGRFANDLGWMKCVFLFSSAIICYALLIFGNFEPMMWQARHLMSHHKFPNVDRCDADIDENPFIRLSPHQPLQRWHRFQHIYAWALYMVVAFHAAWIQDFNYMKRKI